MTENKLWLESRGFDISLWLGTLILSGSFILIANKVMIGDKFPLWAFIGVVVAFDVTHVYGTIYRVYLDQWEMKRRPRLYFGSVLIIYFISMGIYAISPGIFFTCIAYYAVYHFIKQHLGFVFLYKHKLQETNRLDYYIDRISVYTATIYPILWWHTHLPRKFSWFIDGDFIEASNLKVLFIKYLNLSNSLFLLFQNGLYFLVNEILWIPYIIILILYILRQGYLWIRQGFFNPGKNLAMAIPWISWYFGIIYFNNDMIWNGFIILTHAIPYFALVWLYITRKNKLQKRNYYGWIMNIISQPKNWILFYLFLFCIAMIEEFFWDVFVWKQYLQYIFYYDSGWNANISREIKYLFWIPLLSLPQIVHYYLDGKIWRMNKENPDLKQYLFFTSGQR